MCRSSLSSRVASGRSKRSSRVMMCCLPCAMRNSDTTLLQSSRRFVGPRFSLSTPDSARERSSRAGRGETARPGGYSGGPAVVFTGDTLFRNSVGGVRAPGHTSYTDLRDSIMGTLMELPPETVIYPGHAAPTTVGQEWECNSFIRVWRGLDPEGAEPCTAMGQPAMLVLLGSDYDGGTKAWVRWPDGSDDIVPGSRVQKTP